jgi:uncharacterized SAM-binding protein YcdF (DUF218 family)
VRSADRPFKYEVFDGSQNVPLSEVMKMIASKRSASRPSLRSGVALTLVVLALGAILAFRNLGRWLVREDPLSRADAIVVLSGGMPARAEEAAQVFRMNYAPQVWVSRPDSAAAELQKLGISYAGEEEYNRQILMRKGVPADAIRIFPRAIVDTEKEVEEVSRQLRAQNKKSVIIVTSPQHTRRVKVLWRELAEKGQTAIVRAAWEDNFDADLWWRNTRDAFSVAREMMGLTNAWAGLPIRPHAPRSQ